MGSPLYPLPGLSAPALSGGSGGVRVSDLLGVGPQCGGRHSQNQALAALLFLYKQVLEIDLPWLDQIVRSKRPKRLPVVPTRTEVRAVLGNLSGRHWLVASLLYGSGLRLLEALLLSGADLAASSCHVSSKASTRMRISTSGNSTCSPPIIRRAIQGAARGGVRNALARSRVRHTHPAGAARAQQCPHDTDLHACVEPRRARRAQPNGSWLIRPVSVAIGRCYALKLA